MIHIAEALDRLERDEWVRRQAVIRELLEAHRRERTHNPESLTAAEGERVPRDVPRTSNVAGRVPLEMLDPWW